MGRIFQVRALPRRPSSEPERDRLPQVLRFQATDGTYFVEDCALAAARATGVHLELLREIDESEVPVRFLPPTGAHEHPPEEARLAVLARLLAEDRARGEEHVRFLGRDRRVPPDGFELDRAGGRRRYVWQMIPAKRADSLASLREGLPRLRALLGDSDARVVLSLGSGGLKLFAHATVFRMLEEIGLEAEIDEVWGTSGGALAGLLYAHGLSPEAMEQAGYDLYSGRYGLSLQPSKIQVLRQLLRDTLLPSEAADQTGFVDCTRALARMIERYCATLHPRRPLYCIAYNLADCRSEVLTSDPVPPHLEGLVARTEAREAALASAAVPLLFVPRRVRLGERDVPYVDGSTTEEVPLPSVLSKWELDREAAAETRTRLVILYVKLTGTPEIYRTPHGRMGKLRLLQTIASAGMEAMHRRDVALISRRPDVRLIALHLPGSSPDFFETGRIPQFIRLAREAFPQQLLDVERALEAEVEAPQARAGRAFERVQALLSKGKSWAGGASRR